MTYLLPDTCFIKCRFSSGLHFSCLEYSFSKLLSPVFKPETPFFGLLSSFFDFESPFLCLVSPFYEHKQCRPELNLHCFIYEYIAGNVNIMLTNMKN